MDYRTFIARRYLLSSRKISLISVITSISVGGITLGVAALIVVLSVMNGFFDLVRDMLVSFDPHVRIVSTGKGVVLSDTLITQVLKLPHVESAMPYVEGKALLTYHGAGEVNKVVIVRGVEVETLKSVSNVTERITYGAFDLKRKANRPGIVVGFGLASRLGLFPGSDIKSTSTISLLSGAGLERALTQGIGFPPYVTFDVRGLYELQSVYDDNHVFVELSEAQRLLRIGKKITGVELRLDDLESANQVKTALQGRLDPHQYEVLTWYDLQHSLYDVMRLEKWGASLILALVILVAAFNIVGSLTMIVIEKRRDLAVLQAMGVSRKNVGRIFLIEGLLIAVVGSGAGLVLGLGLAGLQKYFEFVPLANADSFIIDSYPVSIQPLDIVIIVVIVIVLCLLAALYPAIRATKMEPARAVRNE